MNLDRSRFEHLYVELSLACGRRVPRYRLWLALRESGGNPEALRREHALTFFDSNLPDFLRENGLWLSRWKRRKVRRSVLFFDPAISSPDELLARLDSESA